LRVVPSVEWILRESARSLDPLDAQVLLSHVTGRSKEYLLTHTDHLLTRRAYRRWRRVRAERERGRPVAYITGEREFYGLPFLVDERVLVPRPETETLVDEIVRLSPDSLLDVGTGSGCIAVASAYTLPGCSVTGADRSGRALAVARENAHAILGKRCIRLIRSDYFTGLRGIAFEAIVSNPPYVKRADLERLPVEVRHEPVVALDGGPDGLDSYRVLVGRAHRYLEEGGWLALEIDPPLLSSLLRLEGMERFTVERVARDLSGRERVIVLRLRT
jgi:release factor glutamine methyltransferase